MTMFSYKQSTLLRSRLWDQSPSSAVHTRPTQQKETQHNVQHQGQLPEPAAHSCSSATGSLRLKFAYISLFNVFLRDSALQKRQRYLQVSLREVWFSPGFGGIAGSRHTSTDENHTNDKPLITLSESTGWRWRDGQNGHFLPFAFESGGNSEVCECVT